MKLNLRRASHLGHEEENSESPHHKQATGELCITNKQQVSYVASRASRPPADGLDLHDNTTAEIIQEGIY